MLPKLNLTHNHKNRYNYNSEWVYLAVIMEVSVKKICLAALFLILSISLFAQADYMFVVEKQTGNDVNIPIFQTLSAALVTDVDTLSVVSFSDRAAYLFNPLPGNIPDFLRIAGEKILSDPLRGTGTFDGFSDAVNLANEQAKAWGRKDIPQKLIIIANTLSGKNTNISPPDAFENNIYYLSINTPLEQVIKDIIDEDANGNLCAWAVDTNNLTPQDPEFYTFDEGLFACINAIAPNRYKKSSIGSDFLSFTAGNLLQQIRKAVILVENTSSNDKVTLSKQGGDVPVPEIPWSAYTVLPLENAGMGTYEVKNGKIVLVLVQTKISDNVWIFGIITAGILALLCILFIRKLFKAIIKTVRPVQAFEVSYQVNGSPSGRDNAKIYKKKHKRNKNEFESPVIIKQLITSMGITDALDTKIVSDKYPHIIYKEDKNTWYIEYAPDAVDDFHTAANSIDDASSAWGGGTDSQEAYTNNNAEDKPQDEEIRGNSYVLKRIFEKDSRNKLVLSRTINK